MLHSYVQLCGVNETPSAFCMLQIPKCLPWHLNAEGKPVHHGNQTQPLGGEGQFPKLMHCALCSVQRA